jgi:hypothetical protein
MSAGDIESWPIPARLLERSIDGPPSRKPMQP